ncbi:hypothetical protein Ciccas_006205 [Cichlidogyrus casuarinus]|uniref:Uncharacterized protein n=1 Tax=Cichlidogyrus casuarinus TaxID=1844966 RepID=A0ABD2Q6F2_9PLAT
MHPRANQEGRDNRTTKCRTNIALITSVNEGQDLLKSESELLVKRHSFQAESNPQQLQMHVYLNRFQTEAQLIRPLEQHQSLADSNCKDPHCLLTDINHGYSSLLAITVAFSDGSTLPWHDFVRVSPYTHNA